jgi:putative transcriptional regulator
VIVLDIEFEKKLEELKEKIAGEIIFAPDVSATFKKWRNIFEIGQKKLAMSMNVKVSTISDYENGRRNNPGLVFIKRYIDTTCKIDLDKKGEIIKSLISETIIRPFEVREFKKIIKPLKLFDILKLYDVNSKKLDDSIFGITYIDTLDIKDYDLSKYPLIFGRTNKRLLYFSKTTDLYILELYLKIIKTFYWTTAISDYNGRCKS